MVRIRGEYIPLKKAKSRDLLQAQGRMRQRVEYDSVLLKKLIYTRRNLIGAGQCSSRNGILHRISEEIDRLSPSYLNPGGGGIAGYNDIETEIRSRMKPIIG